MRGLFLLFFIFTPLPAKTSLQAKATSNTIKKAEQCDLSYIESLAGINQKIPKNFLDRVTVGINFALANDAAKEISRQDLFHAHILVKKNEPWNIEKITDTTLLFHTQEKIYYTAFYKLRNIILGPSGKPMVLPCSLGLKKRFQFNDDTICTVSADDLEMDNPYDIFFVPVNSCPSVKLRKYKNNIRNINNQKILFRIF